MEYVLSVVELDGPVVGDELVTQGADLAVQDQTLEVKVGIAEDGHGGGCNMLASPSWKCSVGCKTHTVVAATALETDETVLDNVNTANTVGETDLVEGVEKLNGVGVLLLGSDKLGGNTLLEVDGEVGGLVGSGHRVGGHGPHVSGGSVVGVLQDTY